MMTTPRPARRPGGHLFLPARWHRPQVLKWLRRTHAWLGLWGALLGLLFGGTGFLLNHRATLKIPAAKYAEQSSTLPLPAAPTDPAALGRWLQTQLQWPHPPGRPRVEPAHPAPWGEGQVQQPAHWQFLFARPGETVSADYWEGNRSVSLKRMQPNSWAWLTRLHTATGAGVGWILLADTLAGALIMLCLTGFLLWTRLHGPRLLALGLLGTCGALALGLALT